ncbi:hypothetical protein [Bryobacter aggregatus]|uniref:hypothetical protein n=1 Tax=Bryobacter aggregatus TaxID=360054 RepID=UPI0004E15C8B|nr:hypothetical protein [Bryobacter aggregatus]
MKLLFLLASPVMAATFYVNVGGLGGQEDYETRFKSNIEELDKLTKAAPDAKVFSVSGAQATKVRLKEIFAQVAHEAKPDDTVVVTLIGHGTFDGFDYKFNLPGPDMAAKDLALWMLPIAAKRQVVVNTTSASGGSLAALRQEGRVVITATKSGTEKLSTVFPRYWLEALRDPQADADKNETITALEAYRYAESKTTKYYETNKRLATEHPLLADTASAAGFRIPDTTKGEAVIAMRTPVLLLGSLQNAAKTPEKQALLRQREALEQQVDNLKLRKAAMPADQYRLELRNLILQLARVQQELDK